MGNTASCAPSTSVDGCPVNHEALKKEQPAAAQASGCPVKHDAGGGGGAAAAGALAAAAAVASASGAENEAAGKPKRRVYNVYGEEVDPTNSETLNPNQLPRPGQDRKLSQSRAVSGIPKGGADDETWTYPSPQMFYNALHRKQKGEGVSAADVDLIVAIHNGMNEHTWNEVTRWEGNFHGDASPRLLKFCGRPTEPSPLARVRGALGLAPGALFDRHDWTVQRSTGPGGEAGAEARYVIDYYHRDAAHGGGISVEVRPALDSPAAAFDRVRAFVRRHLDGDGPGGLTKPPEAVPSKPFSMKEPGKDDAVASDEEFHRLAGISGQSIRANMRAVEETCAEEQQRMASILSGASSASASAVSGREAELAKTKWSLCAGKILCPEKAEPLAQALRSSASTADEVDGRISDLDACLGRYGVAVNRYMAAQQGKGGKQ